MCVSLGLVIMAVGGYFIAESVTKSSSKAPDMPQVPDLPPLPDPEIIKTQAKDDAAKRRALATKTIQTSGAGVIEEGNLQKKTLLGG